MPAFADASIAASPRVGPTVLEEISSTWSGSAPPSISSARSLAWDSLEAAGDVGAAGDAAAAGHRDVGRGDDVVVEDDGDPPRVALLARGLAAELAERLGALAVEVDGDLPADALLGLDGVRAVDLVAGQGRGAELEGLPGLLGGDDQVVLLGRLGVGRGGLADHRVHGQLRGATDDLLGLGRVLHVGQLDEDAVLPDPGQRGLGDTDGVDPAAEDLDRAVDGLGVRLDVTGVLRLEHDLRPAAEVEAEAWLLVQREGDTADEQTKDEQETDEGTAGHAAHPPRCVPCHRIGRTPGLANPGA